MNMQWKIISSLFVMLFILGSVCGSSVQAESRANPTDYRVSNAAISIGISKRDAGAVSSIFYDGHEFVNDFDHGRQLQAAWVYNEMGEAYNPTEAGNYDDDRKRTSTSELLSVNVDRGRIITENHPAYWWRPGRGVNEESVTKDTLKKTITLGYRGNRHIIVFDASITISPELSGPPIKKIRVEGPAFYTDWMLTEHYQLDRRNGSVEKISMRQADKTGRMNDRMRLNPERQLIPILSSPDGRYAVAVYTPQAEGFWAYSSYVIPAHDPAGSCNKVSTRFRHPAETGRTYSYRTFIMVGNLETVKNAAMSIP